MAKTRKQTRPDRKTRDKLVRTVVRNKFYDPKLADKVSKNGWSDERLYRELGVTIPKKTPKLKPLTKESRRRGKRRLEHTVFGIELGLSPQSAAQLYSYSKRKIEQSAVYERSLSYDHEPAERDRRYLQWKKWSSGKGMYFPPFLRRKAVQYNKDRGYDSNEKWGFILAFNVYVEGRSMEEILATVIKPDKFSASGGQYIEDRITGVKH